MNINSMKATCSQDSYCLGIRFNDQSYARSAQARAKWGASQVDGDMISTSAEMQSSDLIRGYGFASHDEDTVRIGNSGLSFGYIINQNNSGNNEDTLVYQIPLKTINTVFPIRTTFLQDTASGGYESVLLDDLTNEQSNYELSSACKNNDQSGVATPGGLGGTDGLRGLIGGAYPVGPATYAGGTITPAAYGTSGLATTNGLHQLSSYDQITSNGFGVGTNNVTYKDVVTFLGGIDVNYFDPMNKLYVNTQMVSALRGLTDNNGRPIWIDGLRMGDGFNVDRGNGMVGSLLGHEVYLAPFLDLPWSLTGTAGTVEKFPMIYANWEEFFNTVDSLNLIMRRYDQTLPGSVKTGVANDFSYAMAA